MHEDPNRTTVTESPKRRHWGTIVLWVAPLAVALLLLGYGFLTPIRGFAVVIIYTWLFWTLPIHLSHAYSQRLFRPPRPRRFPLFEL